MQDQKLYIIGNGFDLHHEIPTAFFDFRKFVGEHDADLLKTVEHYLLGIREDWRDLESVLTSIDVEGIVSDLEHFMPSYGAEDWSDSGHHDFQYEVGRIVESLFIQLRHRLAQWIRLVPIPTPATALVRLRNIDPSALFLTFNYTPTLEKLYRVPDERVLHIHGRSDLSDDTIVLGHAWNPQERPSLAAHQGVEDFDERLTEAYGILDRYFSDTFKPSTRLIDENAAFFQRLRDVEEIWVLGHSLSSVDMPYFRAVITMGGSLPARWRVACHQESDFRALPQALRELGVESSRITPSGWADF